MSSPSPYQAVVFAGGGCRCFWQVGFWETAAPTLGIVPETVGAVSAGAAMACLIFAGATERGMDEFCRRTAANAHNVYPLNLLRGERVFPHERIYRETILRAVDEPALARLHAGPNVRVMLARPPGWLGPHIGVLAGLLAYQAEKLVRPHVHPRFGRRAGFSTEEVSVRDCATPVELADLILQSSGTPPVTPLYHRGGRPALDGSIVDNVPVEAVDDRDGPVLVLLTRRYEAPIVPTVPGRTYVQPSAPIPVAKWDYTAPDAVRATYDLGRRDGDLFVRTVLGATGRARGAVVSTHPGSTHAGSTSAR